MLLGRIVSISHSRIYSLRCGNFTVKQLSIGQLTRRFPFGLHSWTGLCSQAQSVYEQIFSFNL